MGTENRSFCENSKKNIFFWGGGGGGGRVRGGGGALGCGVRVDVNGGPIRGWGGGGGGSKVWGRWVMWGMGDVNQE